MPVDNKKHKWIDDVSTDLKSRLRYTVNRDNLFRIVTHGLSDSFVQASQ